jgi:hypothetical protein
MLQITKYIVGFFVPGMEKALAELEPKGWQVTSAIEVDGAKMFKINNSKTLVCRLS